ncbi:hypothetical protein AAVH_24803, partial [Aphelenchoides avenae]
MAVPVCLTDPSNENDTYLQFTSFHFGTRSGVGAGELARSMYRDVLYPEDAEKCSNALGEAFHEDTQFCVGKRNQVFAEVRDVFHRFTDEIQGLKSVHGLRGAPNALPEISRTTDSVKIAHWGRPNTFINGSADGTAEICRESTWARQSLSPAVGGRFIQVGIALKADSEHNYGSATRVSLYQKEIYGLTGCYLHGTGPDSEQADQRECKEIHHRAGELVRVPGEMTFEEAEKACLQRHGTIATPNGPENLAGFFE